MLVFTPAADPFPGIDPAVNKKKTSKTARYRSIVFDTIDGKEPDVTTSTAYVSAVADSKDIKGFEPNGLLIFDPGKGKSFLAELSSLFDEPTAPPCRSAHTSRPRMFLPNWRSPTRPLRNWQIFRITRLHP